ncbi:arm repeat-containing protein [Curvularia clavata]|uniref:Arm repeat-containing protein n=1 Tax=Curvularia clavata TaxID=95742 RepID=A0A9Q8Z068_CURCL|nr:arm repeat-containing protein [Curvularia clavata]
MKQQVRLEAATLFPYAVGFYGPPREYWTRRYLLGLPLDPMDTRNSPYGRPGLPRAYSTGSGLTNISQQSAIPRRRSQPIPPPTFAERVALGPQLNPWHPKNPYRLERRGSIHDVYTARREQRLKEEEDYVRRLLELRRQQQRIAHATAARTRQLDGSRSNGSTPNVSRSSSEMSLLRVSSWKNLFKERTAKRATRKYDKAKNLGLSK